MQTIFFTTAYWHEIEQKLNIYKVFADNFIDINIKLFSNQFNELFFVFQCFPLTSSRKVEEFKTLRRKTKPLELYLILDYERIMQGTDEENLLHIKEVFLKGCETFLKPLNDFKWEEFELKIKELL